MKIFSKEKYIEVEGYEDYMICKQLVDWCDGKEVIEGKCKVPNYGFIFSIADRWCIEKKSKEELNESEEWA